MLKISKKKNNNRFMHSSSIEGDLILLSPENKNRNLNYQQNNSKYIQPLIGMSL